MGAVQNWITRDEFSSAIVSNSEGKGTERFSENSSRNRDSLKSRFGSLEIIDTSVTRVTNKSWSDCALSEDKRVRGHLRAQGHLDQVQELLLCGLLQGPHAESDESV